MCLEIFDPEATIHHEEYSSLLSSIPLRFDRMTEPENPQRRSSRSLFRDEVEVLSTMHHPNIIRCSYLTSVTATPAPPPVSRVSRE